MRKRFILPLCILLVFYTFNIRAQWSNFTTVNTPVSVPPKSQQNAHGVTDKKGGIIAAWDDNRNSTGNSTDIYAQRLNSAGQAKWPANGVAVCTNTLMQRSVNVAEDGVGGAIFVWEDNRNGNYDIYAQHIDSSGNALWTADGVAVCSKTTNQKNPKIITDQAGGAIIVWEDSVNIYWDIYAQRISSTGNLLWTSGGVGICTAPNMQNNPRLDIDGAGGAIITWQDKRGNVDYDIYAQRVNATGATQWNSNGVVVCNATNTQNNPRVEPDGASGAYIAWVDKRTGFDYDIYAQRLDASGAAQWTGNGVVVCNASTNQSAVDMKYFGSGLILSWKDERNGSYDIYMQVLNSSGVASGTANGVKLSSALKSINPNSISDGTGNAIVVWQDSTVAGWDVTSQKVNASAVIQWTAGGVTVSNASDDQVNPSQVSDGHGGAIYIWEDHRNTADYDVYAQHLYTNGAVSVGIEEYTQAHANNSLCYPNPVSDVASIRLKNPEPDQEYTLNIYDIYGNIVGGDNMNQEGVFRLMTSAFSAGIYYYTISTKYTTLVSKGHFSIIR
ncbi:MAG: T9SS type A sorting domain-containing protein [Bacteroidetes bacterium]|nr:T9SS type A sorting domain-containing protein [Bacteroidota bacterium]